jgi:hypothetical protein
MLELLVLVILGNLVRNEDDTQRAQLLGRLRSVLPEAGRLPQEVGT